MSKFNIFPINWVESENTVVGEACFGNIVINKNDNIAHVFGMTGTRKFYPSIAKSLKNDRMRLKELMERLDSIHISRIKYSVGAWVQPKDS